MSALSILRTHLGVDGPDLARSVQRLDEAGIAELAELIAESDWFDEPAPDGRELWPLVSSRMSTFTPGGSNPGFVEAGGPAGLNLWASLDPRFAGSGRFPNGIMRALLYCHGLVIEDPLAMSADMYRTTSHDARHLARMAIESATVSLLEIDRLLDAAVVRTFSAGPLAVAEPIASSLSQRVFENSDVELSEDAIWNEFEASYIAGLDPRLQSLWSEVRGGNRNPPLDAIRSVAADGDAAMAELFIDVLQNLQPRGVVENALDAAAHAIAESMRLGRGVDLLCPTSLFAKLVVAGVDDVHDLRLHELARTDVPGLDGLLLDDAVSIRLTSEAFDRWRRDLSLALDRASSVRDRVGPGADTSEVVRESIATAREQVIGEADRFPRSAGVASTVSFTAGLLGGAVAGSPGGPVGAAIGAAGAAVPMVAAGLAKRWRAPADFLHRHYLVFESPAGASWNRTEVPGVQ